MCETQWARSLAAKASGAGDGAYLRLADEPGAVFPHLGDPLEHFSRTRNADIWGGDIRSGREDPLLAGITEPACAMLCRLDARCGAYTFNGRDGDVCFLKTGAGRMSRYDGAISGVLTGTHLSLPPPPTRGPMPVVDASVGWRQGDTEESYTARVRAAARPLARSCEAERADLAALSASMRLMIPDTTARVGETFALRWSGNDLVERIPVWTMASTPTPVRFEGEGFFALGPDTPSPFGIASGEGETRALTALWARGAGTSGTFGLVPLVAGEMPVTLRLVAWLRDCNEEVVLRKETAVLDVAPAPAQLVVGTPGSRADLTHEIELPRWDRRILLNETRIRIESTDGTEIVERAGRDLTLSPTMRFIEVVHDEMREVVDVIDGRAIAQSAATVTAWALGDALWLASSSPRENFSIHTTMSPSIAVAESGLGSSCCTAFNVDIADVSGAFSVDLQNGLFGLASSGGGVVLSLQVPKQIARLGVNYTRGENAVADQRVGFKALQLLRTTGLVAPFPGVLVGPNGTLKPGYGKVEKWAQDEQGRNARRDWREILADRASVNGWALRALRVNSPPRRVNFQDAMVRIGIALVDRTGPTIAMSNQWTSEYADERYLSRSENAIRSLKDDLSRAKWDVVFSEEEDRFERSSCAHAAFDDYFIEQRNMPGTLSLPREMSAAHQIVRRDSSHWVIGYTCEYGGTLGGLGIQTALLVLDLDRPQPSVKDLVVLEGTHTGGSYLVRNSFQATDYTPSISGEKLILFSPEVAGIVVYDLTQRRISWIDRGLPSGDLMTDALLTVDGNHVVQVNSDGSFHVHRVADGTTVLHGRVVDDEVAVWTADFRFDATAEAAAFIDLRFPGLDGQFSLDRFDPVLHTPGLAAQVLEGNVPPAVRVDVPPDLSGTLTLAAGTIRAEAMLDPHRAATELRLYQDGVLTTTETLAKAATAATLNAPRLPGTRHATLVAASAEGLVSLPVTADLGPAAPGACAALSQWE